MNHAIRSLLNRIRAESPLSSAVLARRHAPTWQAWLTVQQALQGQCALEPRGPWIAGLIRDLDLRMRLQLALSDWNPPLYRAGLLARLRNLLALLPLDSQLQQAGLEMLRGLNPCSLQSLEAQLASLDAGLVVVITGCRHRAEKLSGTMQRFAASSDNASIIGVVGDPSLRDWEFHYCPRTRILTVPVSDAYEALPQKLAWAVLALGLCPSAVGMLKVDDDARPADINAAIRLLDTLKSTGEAAAGYPITTASPLSLDRGWHIGKSTGEANHTAFNSLATKNWMSGGVGYLLAPAGVQIVAEYAMHSWGFFEAMLYEDISITMILDAADAGVHWLHQASQLGIRTERAEEIDQGLWSYDAAMLSQPPC